jgi:O-antigen/teichoic acid export membrane protein
LSILLQHPALSVANGVGPGLARLGGAAPPTGEFLQALRGITLFQCYLVVPALVWAEPITSLLLGPQYPDAAKVLVALTPNLFLQGFAPLVSISVNYLGEARRRVPIAVASAALAAITGVIFIPRYGVTAAALASGGVIGFYVVAHLAICVRLLHLSLAPAARSLLRGLIAAAAMGLVLRAFGTEDVPIVELLAGGVLGTAVFVGVLVLTRELRRSDWSRLARSLRRRSPAQR